MKGIITGIAVLTTAEGKRITYSYSKIDKNGAIVESNIKKSFILMEQDTINLVEQLEEKVKEHLGEV